MDLSSERTHFTSRSEHHLNLRLGLTQLNDKRDLQVYKLVP